MKQAELLGPRIRRHAQERPEQEAFVFLEDGEHPGQSLSYGELDRRARRLAGRLEAAGLVGERALLLYPPGLGFVTALVACLYAGVVAVPVYPPRSPRSTERLRRILEDARARAVLTTTETADPATRGFEPGVEGLLWLSTERLEEACDGWSGGHPPADHLALLQYTSGSTGSPKGVMVSHGNLSHNESLITAAFEQSADSRVLGWLPLFHDMGLIGNVLQPLYLGARCWLMGPLSFVRRPLSWLRAVSRHRITTSGGPNFAYDLCVKELERRPGSVDGLDLSSWRVAFNGSEPVRASTLQAFAEAFAPYGFRAEALAPCYGLAEATLLVSIEAPGSGPRIFETDAGALERHRVSPALGTAPALAVVGCGRPRQEQEVAVVSPQSASRCAEDEVGEIWVAGGSVAQGYWGQEKATEATFGARLATGEGPFLRTGDLGFLRDGTLYVTGRLKELIILRGRNHYPQDFEETAQRSSADLRRGGGAAFSVAGSQGERLVLVQEVTTAAANRLAKDEAFRHTLLETVLAAVTQEHDVRVDDLVLIRSGRLLKTSSGKVRRAACREQYLRDELPVLARARPTETPATPADRPERRLCPEELEQCSEEVRRRRLLDYLMDLVEPGRENGTSDASRPLAGWGLDSLRAVRLVARIEEDLGVDVALDGLPAITPEGLAADLARRLDGGRRDHRDVAAVQPDPEKALDPFPLTDIQQAYWVARSGRLELADLGCHVVLELETERLDPRRVGECWDRLVERHPMLRAVVGEDGTQRVLPRVPPVRVAVLDLAQEAEDERRAAVAKLRESLAESAFDSARWPLFEVRVTHGCTVRSLLHVKVDLLVADASSLRILLREWFELYRQGEVRAEAPALSFRDYVSALGRLSGTPRHRRAEAYWRERLPALPPSPELPLARPPEQVARPRVTTFRERLGDEQVAALRERAKQHGTTLSVVFLTAFAEILAAWSRTPRFTLNLTLFNRWPLHPDVDAVVGDFTSSLPLAVDLRPASPFGARAQKIRRQLWRDLEHRAVSGVELQRRMAGLRGGTLRMPWPVVFTSTLGDDGADEFPAHLKHVSNPTPQVWLNAQASFCGDGVLLAWDVVEELFPPGLVTAMFDAYHGRLRRLARDAAVWSETRHGELLPARQAKQRFAVNDTADEVSQELLHTLVYRQAVTRPQALAILTPEGPCTYGELWWRAQGLAAELTAHGARPGRLVAVVLPKGWQQAVAVLAVSTSGGAYLPVDPGLPTRRRHDLLAQARVDLAVTTESLDESLEWPAGITRCRLDDVLQPVAEAAHPPSTCPRHQRGTDLAYVLYTSGSTGRPKGVMIDHRGAVNTLLDVNRRYRVSTTDRVLGLSALGFDLSVYDLFGVWAAGGAVVLPAAGHERDPEHWAALMRDHGVTLWNSVPALLQMLVEFLEGRRRATPGSVRCLLLSGDWIPLDLPERTRRLWPGAEVHSLGGATEASIWSIAFPIGEVDPAWSSIPYGKPMVNQTFHVFDERLEPRPDWVPGDLYIGGAGLARGYWRDPRKTAEAFLAHPQTGERLYRTGDLGRYLPGGDLELLGRNDRQVKLDGFRVELGEVEAVGASCPGVRVCVASVETGADGRRRLAVHAVPEPAASVTAETLRSFLAARLPRYMVPACQILDALPLTANGKVDRRRLGALAVPAPADPKDEGRPPSRLQQELTGIVCEVLGLEQAGQRQNFFDLGANSVQLIQVHRKLENALGREVPVVTIFRHPTIAALADALEAASAAPSGPRVSRVHPPQDQQEKRRQALQRFRQRHGAQGRLERHGH